MKCYNCGSTKSEIKEIEHTPTINGKTINYKASRRVCSKCGEIIYDAELDNIASKKALEIYSEKYGMTKEEILGLRKMYNLSQDLFSKIIGCAKKTIISYEKGTSIPNDNYLITLKALKANPSSILTFIEANKDQYNEKEYNKILEKLNPIISKNIRGMILNEESELTEYNGYTELNYDKIKNLILYLTEGSILKTKLLKEMFYIDFLNYKNTGQSITGLEYVKLPFGPVPDDFEKIIIYLKEKNLIEYNIEYSEDCEYEHHKIISKEKYNKKAFNDNELELIKKVKTYFKEYTSKKIVEKSHSEKAFLKTNFQDRIDYNYSFDIDINV